MQPLRFFQTQHHSVVDAFRRTLSALAVVALLLGPQQYLEINRSADAADSELRFIDSENSLAALLQQGAYLEKKQKWGEALSHYEDAIKRFPHDQTLQGHQDLARIHYDLDRRYDDRSYRATMEALSTQQANELYEEVLLKVDSYFVQKMDWQLLVDRGTRCLEIAIWEGVLVNGQQTDTADPARAIIIKQLKQFIDEHPIKTREEAVAIASATAAFVSAELGVTQTAVIPEYVAGADRKSVV